MGENVTVTFLWPLALWSPTITSHWLNSASSQLAGVPTEAKHSHQSRGQGRVEKHEMCLDNR